MGADLYIDKMPGETRRGGFEGRYFRDCYNNTGLFSVISANTSHELSWWKTVGRKNLGFDSEGRLTVKGAKKWLAELEPIMAEFKALPTLYYSDYSLMTHKDEKGKIIENPKEYHDWADLLLTFLRTAIELKSTITMSV